MSAEPPTEQAEIPWGEERRREVTWHDPSVGALAGRELAGRDYLSAMIEGRLPPPPIAQTLGFTLTRIADGEAWFSCEPHESQYNPIGIIHGGLVCTLLDSALACAVHTQLPAGVGYTSIELKVSYLRAVSAASGTLTAHGHVTKPGRRVAFAEGEVRTAAGAVVATASSSCLIIGPAS
ncbi:PaaI family thioesterase [Microlunatus aurantiacus]|uniref:PaaI family thioesterase n=1 Tax=Microlunatus aurantiacus TaxID=446786 RepID=A0ABP7CN23_9ACTN